MTDYITEFKYELMHGFEYAKHGDVAVAEYLLIKAPANNDAHFVGIMETEISKAQRNAMESKIVERAEQSDEKPKGSVSMIDMVKIFGEEKALSKMVEALGKVLCRGNNCLIDGDVKMQSSIFNEMPYRESKKILDAYLTNFTDTSL